jgi:L-malate glycosyltransferase
VGLSGDVTFLGGYTSEKLGTLLADSDVYVSAALWDGTSISLLEAMASGAFPVVSDFLGNRDWLTGDGDGLFFDSRNPQELADRLQWAAENPAVREGAIAVNRRRVKERADRSTNMTVLTRMYEGLISSRRS